MHTVAGASEDVCAAKYIVVKVVTRRRCVGDERPTRTGHGVSGCVHSVGRGSAHAHAKGSMTSMLARTGRITGIVQDDGLGSRIAE